MYSLWGQYPFTRNEAFPNSSTRTLIRIPNLNDINPIQTKKHETAQQSSKIGLSSMQKGKS